MTHPKGEIWAMDFITCGICDEFDSLPDETEPDDRPLVQRAEDVSWQRTIEHGWICPVCAQGYRPSKTSRSVKARVT